MRHPEVWSHGAVSARSGVSESTPAPGRCHSAAIAAAALPAAAMKRPLLVAALVAPLLLTAAPRSPLAHDAGYYALQAHWLAEQGPWLAPLWFGQPLFDRTPGVQWLIALSLKLAGGAGWAVELPSLLAAALSLLLTGWLARRLLPGSPAERGRLALLSVLLLALLPLWLNQAHLATQDMPLLAVELAGIAALVASERQGRRCWPLLAGLTPGIAFLIKGFMVVVPVLAITPYLLIERRWLLRRWPFWLGLALGWLAVALWLALSIHTYGLATVAGLWNKLRFLAASDVYAAGPLYYLWNLPANTAPWILAALAGWPQLWRSGLERGARLLLLLYPLLLLLLLSAFRTKTPYYGLQLTPWIAMAAALALRRWSGAARGVARRPHAAVAAVGAALVGAGVLALLPASPLRALLPAGEGLPALPPLAAAALAVGGGWLVLPWQPSPPRRLAALLLGPWLALALLTQAGLFSDRSPALRRALAAPAAGRQLAGRDIQAAVAGPLPGADHAQLILLALATPRIPGRLLEPAAVGPGERVWIRRQDLAAAGPWRIVLDGPALQGWVLAERLTPAPGAAP